MSDYDQYEKPEPEFETVQKPYARCPSCGNEEAIETTKPANAIAQVNPEANTECQKCGHKASSFAFRDAYERYRMTQQELEEFRRGREKALDKMADWQCSADYYSLKREP